MIKKMIVPALLIIPLTGCTSDPLNTQCEEDKNYVIKNPIAIEEFLKQKEEGKIKGFFYKNEEVQKCSYGECMEFKKDYEYIERNMIFRGKESIYTIIRTYDLSNPDCIEENWLKIKRRENYCYIVTENKSGEIKSDYMYIYNGKGLRKMILKNIKTNEILFESSYQTYTVKYVGAVGGGNCLPKKDNYPNYDFNIWSLI